MGNDNYMYGDLSSDSPIEATPVCTNEAREELRKGLIRQLASYFDEIGAEGVIELARKYEVYIING